MWHSQQAHPHQYVYRWLQHLLHSWRALVHNCNICCAPDEHLNPTAMPVMFLVSIWTQLQHPLCSWQTPGPNSDAPWQRGRGATRGMNEVQVLLEKSHCQGWFGEVLSTLRYHLMSQMLPEQLGRVRGTYPVPACGAVCGQRWTEEQPHARSVLGTK